MEELLKEFFITDNYLYIYRIKQVIAESIVKKKNLTAEMILVRREQCVKTNLVLETSPVYAEADTLVTIAM